MLNKYTTWAELPRISYEDLFRTRLSPVGALGKQELALPSSLVVTTLDLLSGKADPETFEKIAKDGDILKSIVLTSMARETGKELEAWLLTQQKTMPEIGRDWTADIGGKAQQAVTRLLKALSNNAEELELYRLRESLRSAHDENWLELKKMRGLESSRYRTARRRNQRMCNADFIVRKKNQHQSMWDNDMYCHGMDVSDDRGHVLKERHNDSSKADSSPR
ncbi:hypothetical protein FGG08_006597 [Glutinoglossum americanum]|uniref:Uncharacterized protein n=1 Tax=Glutinoglossum americanum TaxID=1670608 RepID=A0A9P8I341_9PEZI|nr:hypothetical protein FGG08_006597 [Glutinoglossum americanum]